MSVGSWSLLILLGAAVTPARAEDQAIPADLDGRDLAPTVLVAPPDPIAVLANQRPREWTAQVEWVCLTRSNPRHTPIVRTFAGADKLNAADFDFGWTSGLDTTVLFQPTCGPTVEGRFLKLDAWTESLLVQNDPTDVVATNPPSPRNFSFLEKWKYETRLQSAELGLRGDLCEWCSLTGGLRYVRFDEALSNPALVDGIGPKDGMFGTQNELLGLQLGTRAVLWEDDAGWKVTSLINAGVYWNRAESVVDARMPAILFFAKAEDARDTGALVGEMILSAQRRLNTVWSLKAGYHLLWLEGVATAAEQIPRTSDIDTGATAARTSIGPSGSAFFHGIRAGLEANW